MKYMKMEINECKHYMWNEQIGKKVSQNGNVYEKHIIKCQNNRKNEASENVKSVHEWKY